MTKNEQLIYNELPTGEPVPGTTLKLVSKDIDLDALELHGGILVQNHALSLDPYQRGRMRDPKIPSYSPPYELGAPITGFAVATIIRSDHPDFKAGQHVYGVHSFETYSVVGKQMLAYSRIVENKEKLPWTTLVGGVGMSGQTAWYGFNVVGQPKKGETIFVSAASGAVGQIVGQLAHRAGLKVIGSAGSDAKVAFLKELGYDVAFNYKTENTQSILKENPIDIYFDNVGGETLDYAIEAMNTYGRIIACGAVSQYNVPAEKRHALKNYMMIIGKQIRYEGFIVTGKPVDAFFKEMPALVASGEIKIKEHVTQGFDNGEAFVDMLSGKAEGKAVYALSS